MKLSEILTESSQYTKLRQYLLGVKNQGKGIAILTPQNPAGGSDSAEEYDNMTQAEQDAYNSLNKDRMKWGEWLLKRMGKQYFKQKGIFEGQKEESFVILDMSENDTVKLGQKWKQTAVIFSQRQQLEDGTSDLVFKFIETGGKDDPYRAIDSLVKEFFGTDADDYVSVIGGNKYVIPFFDDKAEWEAEYGKDAKPARRKAGKNKGIALYKDKEGNLIAPTG